MIWTRPCGNFVGGCANQQACGTLHRECDMARSLRTLKDVKRNVEQCFHEYEEDTSSQEVARSPVETPAVSAPSQDSTVSAAASTIQDACNTSATDIQRRTGE